MAAMLILFKDIRLIRWVFNVDSIGRASRLSAIQDRRVAKRRTKFAPVVKVKINSLREETNCLILPLVLCTHGFFV